MEYNLYDLMDLSVRILENETEYIFDRNVIDSIFENTKKSFSIEAINIRLTIIDSLYSTNMNRRLFGITDLSKAIFDIGDDNSFLEEIQKYKKNKQDSKISDLLNGDFGIRKTGKKVGEARSLISKYLYFLSNHNFPIEDSLVKQNINNVLNYFFNSSISINCSFLHELIGFCEQKRIKFDEFDNFMWLLGKLSKGSLSLLIQKDIYLKIISKLEIKEIRSSEIDKEIAKKIIDLKYLELIREDISNDLYNFLIFIKDFRKIAI